MLLHSLSITTVENRLYFRLLSLNKGLSKKKPKKTNYAARNQKCDHYLVILYFLQKEAKQIAERWSGKGLLI